jgi:uncharacterized phage infection (PIP) family protein YhgE
MRTLRTVRTLAIFLSVVAPSAVLGQTCSVTFETATVEPSIWESFKTLLKSFNPKGEVERLAALQKEVRQLKEDKHQLSDTLSNILQQNSQQDSQQRSLPDWLKARLQQIPDIQNKVVQLLIDIRSEAAQGGVFGGPPPDKTYDELEQLIDAKRRDLSRLCVLAQERLPLPDRERQELQTLVDNLNKEVDALGDVDNKLGEVIQKAHDQETSAKTKEKKD